MTATPAGFKKEPTTDICGNCPFFALIELPDWLLGCCMNDESDHSRHILSTDHGLCGAMLKGGRG